MQTEGPAPTAQSSSSVMYDKKLITFGGIINGKAQNAVHALNLSEFSVVHRTRISVSLRYIGVD